MQSKWIKNPTYGESRKYADKTVKLLKECCESNTDSFHDIESTLWYFPQCGKYNLNFPHCGNYNVDFPLCGKNGWKFSAKLEGKYFMFHNVQSEHKAIIALKWFAT